MDTSAKKFKYSVFNKILCVLICLLTFLGSVWYAVKTVIAVYYDEVGFSKNSDLSDWTDSKDFYWLFDDDCRYICSNATRKLDGQELREDLIADKSRIVEDAYKQVLKLKKQVKDDPIIEYYYNDEGEEETKVVGYNYGEIKDIYYVRINDTEIDTFYINDNMTKEGLENYFDSHIEQWISDYLSTGDFRYRKELEVSGDTGFYATLDEENIYSNVEKFDEKLVYESPYYFVSKKGELEVKGICQDVAQQVYDDLCEQSKHFKDADFYFWFNVEKLSYEQSIALALKGNAKGYSQLYTARSTIKIESSDKLLRYIAAALIMLVISFVSGFEYFAITGKKSEDEPSRLMVYDYLPFELSVGIAGALGTGIWFLASELNFDYYGISVSLILAMVSAVLLSWILLFFVCASLSRYIKSGRKIYKHFIVYWLLLGIWKVLEYLFKALKWLYTKIANAFKRIGRSVKKTANTFLYKPNRFKRNVIALSVVWLLGNIFMFAIGTAAMYESAGGLLFYIAALVIDFFVLRKVGSYVKNLDKIIDASSRHEEIMLDLEELDNSLKILAEGIRYTNSELQNAISKAVKDERLRTELITNVSHDLKTPLTSIITYVDLLSKCDINDEKATQYIKVLDEKGNKLKRLIDDLIEASKVTSGNVTVNLAPMNLSELCLQATVDAQSDFEKAGLELVVKQGEKPTIVVADGTKTNRIIENLLSNARKYSAKASRVYVNVYDEGDFGIFEIKNISAQALDITPEELTERFVRGDKSRTQEGNGLGLSIAKELCTLQNGNLELIIDGDLFKARVILPNKK